MGSDQERVQGHVVVYGRVQGVYFRGSMKREADQQLVAGWVRNRPDGTVEAVLQGPRDAVSAVLAWMRVGPRGALVESAHVEWSQAGEPLQSFEVVG